MEDFHSTADEEAQENNVSDSSVFVQKSEGIVIVDGRHPIPNYASPRRKKRGVWLFACGMALVLAVVLVIVVVGYLASSSVKWVVEEVADPSLNSAKLAHVKAWCGKSCDPETTKIWKFYMNVGHASAENYMPSCEGHRQSDKDGGVAYRTCLRNVETAMNNPAFDRTQILRWFNSNGTSTCDGVEYDTIRLISICPFDEQQRRLSEPMYSRADMVCFRPGGTVMPLHVGDRDQSVRRDLCGNCEQACTGDWRQWDCCDGRCSNLYTDVDNCGTCGTTCNTTSEKCVAGKCMKVMWDTCNCGGAQVKCGREQMCYKSNCINALTDVDAKHAREMLQCREKDEVRVTPTDFSYQLVMVSEDGEEKQYFRVMDKKHVSLVHRSDVSDPSPGLVERLLG